MSSIKDDDDDNTEGDGWIGSIQQQFYEIRKQVNKMKHEDEIKVTVEKAKRIRDFGYSNLRVMYSNIDLLIEKKCPIASIERERTITLQQFTDVKESHIQLSVLLVDEKESHDWLMKLVSEFSKMNCIIDSYIATANIFTPKSSTNIQLQKIPLPKFEGDIRTYPRFRRDFVELVMPTLNESDSV